MTCENIIPILFYALILIFKNEKYTEYFMEFILFIEIFYTYFDI